VHYQWHPWAGRAVLAQITKQDAWRCCLESEGESSGQLIPVWMLDEAACASLALADRPVVAWTSLQQLERLIRSIRTEALDDLPCHPEVSDEAKGSEP
jgi:hypothetical protein